MIKKAYFLTIILSSQLFGMHAQYSEEQFLRKQSLYDSFEKVTSSQKNAQDLVSAIVGQNINEVNKLLSIGISLEISLNIIQVITQKNPELAALLQFSQNPTIQLYIKNGWARTISLLELLRATPKNITDKN